MPLNSKQINPIVQQTTYIQLIVSISKGIDKQWEV